MKTASDGALLDALLDGRAGAVRAGSREPVDPGIARQCPACYSAGPDDPQPLPRENPSAAIPTRQRECLNLTV